MVDKTSMRNLKFTFFFFTLTLLLASCGADKLSPSKTATTTKSVNTLGGAQCACNSEGPPVCGVNGITYANSCVASCHGINESVQGNCECSVAQFVCADDNQTYNECEAQAAIRNKWIKRIVKYGPCGSATL